MFSRSSSDISFEIPDISTLFLLVYWSALAYCNFSRLTIRFLSLTLTFLTITGSLVIFFICCRYLIRTFWKISHLTKTFHISVNFRFSQFALFPHTINIIIGHFLTFSFILTVYKRPIREDKIQAFYMNNYYVCVFTTDAKVRFLKICFYKGWYTYDVHENCPYFKTFHPTCSSTSKILPLLWPWTSNFKGTVRLQMITNQLKENIIHGWLFMWSGPSFWSAFVFSINSLILSGFPVKFFSVSWSLTISYFVALYSCLCSFVQKMSFIYKYSHF